MPPKYWIPAATFNFEDAAAQWLYVYKKTHTLDSWPQFVMAIEEKFGKDDYRKTLTEFLELRQTTSVEEYYQAFQPL